MTPYLRRIHFCWGLYVRKMIFELLLIFPLYTIIFGIFFRFRHVIIKMTEIDEIFSAMSSKVEEVSK